MRSPLVLAVSTAVLLALTGCVPAIVGTAPLPTNTSTTAAPAVESITFDADATVLHNFDVFNNVAANAIAAGTTSAQDFGAALVAAGFTKSTLQVSQDTTSAELTVQSVSFAAKVGDDNCFIGQFGPAGTGYHSQMVDPIQTGACLIGNTVPLR